MNEGAMAQKSKLTPQEQSNVGGFWRQTMQEAKTRKTEKGSGRLALGTHGLAARDFYDPKARQERWGDRAETMTGMMKSLRNRARQINQKDTALLGQFKNMGEKAASQAFSMATSELLQQSWLNLIDSYGLTLLYINFHVFCRWSLPGGEELFCKLGHEWMGGKSGGAAGKAGAGGTSTAVKSLFGLPLDGVGLLEVAALALLDLVVLVLLLIAIAPFVLIIYIFNDTIGALSEFGIGMLIDLVKAALGLT